VPIRPTALPVERGSAGIEDASSDAAEADTSMRAIEPGIGGFQVLAGPVAACFAAVAAALLATSVARVDFTPLFVPYFSTSIAVTILCVLLSVFWWVLKLALQKADKPLQQVWTELRPRLLYLLLPTIVFPLFLVSYTAAKTSIPFIVGYSWDGIWAEADRLIFRDDAWRITHRLLGEDFMVVWQWFYTVAWGGAFIVSSALIPLNARPRFTAIFYTAMIGSWLLGGIVMAYLVSAAGPVFAPMFDPRLAAEFGPLHQSLERGLAADGPIGFTQHYLASIINMHVATKGGGISAMPSMHLAAASVYVLAARRTRWFAPTIAFWLIIFVCSGYFGYHYWVDGIAAAAVATLCWKIAEWSYQRIEVRLTPPAQTVPVPSVATAGLTASA